MRRSFELTAEKLQITPKLYVLCSGHAEIFINGQLAANVPGPAKEFKDDYQWVPILNASCLQPGPNVIAVHGQSGPGGRFLDIGIVGPL